jgi:anti-sigma-K factor RskA
MNCEHIQELLPAYALGALSVEEQVLVDAHLARCPDCRAELGTYQPAVSSLAFAAEVREPSPELRDRVLAQVAGTPVDFTAARGRREHQGRLIPFPRWALAAAAVFVGLVVWNVVLQMQIIQQRDSLARQAEVVTLVALAEEPGAILQGTETAPLARGRLIPDRDGHGAALVVQGMPAPPPGRVYQLWLIRPDGERDSGGVFTVDDGHGVMYVHAPTSVSEYVAVGVTDEPPGGSPGPTGTKVLGGKL